MPGFRHVGQPSLVELGGGASGAVDAPGQPSVVELWRPTLP